LPAAAGDADGLDRQAARQDHEHEAGQEPRPADHRAGERAARPVPAARRVPRRITAVSGPDETKPDEDGKGGAEPSEAASPDRASSEQTHGAQAAQGAAPPPPATPAAPPAPDASAEEEQASLPARLGEERLAEPVVRTGLFGIHGTPDTSGYGGLRVHRA